MKEKIAQFLRLLSQCSFVRRNSGKPIQRSRMASSLLRKMIMHAPDKSSGKRRQKVEIIFHFVDEAEIPVLAELMIAESAFEHKKRRNLYGHTVFCSNYSSLRLLSLSVSA